MNWDDKLRRDVEAYSVGPVEDLIIYKEIAKQDMMMKMINQMGLIEKWTYVQYSCDRIRCNKQYDGRNVQIISFSSTKGEIV